ncbi:MULTISPECIES: SE2200 family small protein [unclassified Staphylococcus]|nr:MULTISPECIES: SE2200 family small protein [unclassified Staphylococcus]UXR69739.1 DUF2648 domain-containing protein [Staphylococcus sp. IVB6246]UXR71775.1 DUF2648 domain-containing protein [Staphylococcus sp. IVB6240]UXR74081.1 DUF2648 domain-containing protein [Staphylococcus sp. IVB6238]UXR76471.1 DUF2648 domain-containing protein [Staphylococcus sp. IVB6233]UXR80598.1 DUF2648 domain-containing protein [Staphylococcus sp. IVB6218]
MKKLIVVSIILGVATAALKRYQTHVNKMPNIEY